MDNIIWHCPQVTHFLTRTVKRHLEHPQLWHEVVCPVPTLNLVYSQPGNHLNKAVRDLVHATGLSKVTQYWACSRNIKDTAEARRIIADKPGHLLVIEDAHLLIQMPELYEFSLDLANRMPFTFILALSTVIPKFDDFFWDQFDKNRTILYSLPTREKRQEVLHHLWELWAIHGHPVNLTPEDLQWLVDACDFCTTTDILNFVRRVTRYLLDQEEATPVTRKLLESRFIYPNVGLEQTPSICNTDRSTERHRYMSAIEAIQESPKGVEEVTAYLDRQKELKKRKLEEDKLEIK